MTLDNTIQRLLGCGWGRVVLTPEDSDPCPERAARILVLHCEGNEIEARLCARHVDAAMAITTPHLEEP